MPSAVAAGFPVSPDPLDVSFRKAMRRLTAGVSIVTGRLQEAPCGIAATSVTSLTIGPPALLVCVNRATRLHAALGPAAPFCINLLSAHHEHVSRAFGGGNADRFAFGHWSEDEAGMPALKDALASISCRVALMTDYGTHSIVVGNVTSVRFGAEAEPLLYGDGRYR